MVGGVKAIFLGLLTMSAVLLGVGCGVSKAEHEKTVAEHEKTVAELEKTVAELEKTVAELEKTVAGRKKSVAAPEVREDPRGRLSALEAQNAALRKLVKDLKYRLDRPRPKPKPKGTLRPVPSRNGK